MRRTTDRNVRHARVRAKIKGTAQIPRLSVFRSAKHIVVQLIDDEKGATIVFADDLQRKKEKRDGKKMAPIARAEKVGHEIAARALDKKITQAVFDRGGYRYHGIIKAVAEGARKGGLRF